MKRSTLAAGLMRAGTDSQRKKLIAANPGLADVRLARHLKDRCYRVWTSEPADARNASAALKTLTAYATDRETEAIARWVDGIADITSGKLESAVTNLDAASRLLSRLGHENESAQPLVAKLIALAMLGRYRAAQITGENALRIFRKYGDQLAAGKIEMNLSNIVSRRDQYKLAERYCLSAYRRFKKLGERSWQTMAENGLANTYAELNEFDRAEEFYARALATARSSRMRVTIAEIEASMGNLALFRGRYADAIRMLELSRKKYQKLGMPHQTAIAELEIADIYGELNLTSEASGIYRRLIPALHRLKMRAEEARARANFGRTLIATENFKNARAELKRAAELFERERNPTASAAVRLRLASLEVSQGNYAGALAIVESTAAGFDQTENARVRISALWLRGEILANMGRYKDAERLLHAALKESRKFEQLPVAQAAMNSLGMIALKTGATAKAETMFKAAIASAESARAPLPGEEFRIAFLAKSLEPYENLTRLYLEQGRLENAFESVESARARSLFESVGSRVAGRKNDEAAKIREELNWFYSRLARADEDDVAGLQRQIRSREKKLASHAIRTRGSSRSSAKRGSSRLDLAKLQKQLGGEKVLLEFVARDGEYSVFVVTNDRIEFVANIASETEIAALLEGLHFQFGSLRFGGEAMAAFALHLKERADVYLSRLHEALLSPISRGLKERELIVVPAGVLNYVPFHALKDSDGYVVENHTVSYSPSAAVWSKLDAKGRRPSNNSLLMAYADDRIPLADQEVKRLAKLLPKSEKLTGKQATFAAFRNKVSAYDLVHLACHGQFRADNPMFSSLHLADGWVTVRDVCDNKMKAQLVTLSACETGLNKVLAGDEILGLARGFLSAGARSLLLSLWTVNDEATTRLMQLFYSNLQREADVSASLRIAQKDFIERGEHPYFWSPFFVIA